MIEVIRVSSPEGKVLEPEFLERAESVHRQLRPQVPPPYRETMVAILAQGAEMCVAVEGGNVAGVAVFRIIHNTASGRKLYVDDLVTDEAHRSTGVGRAILTFLEREARARECNSFDLDSGTQRKQAHKFYFREGFLITAFYFSKPL